MTKELTRQQLERQDFVDNEIRELLGRLGDCDSLNFSMASIGEIRDFIAKSICRDHRLMSEQDFYPFTESK